MKRIAYGLFFGALLLTEALAFSADKLVIISPHRKSLETEILPLFKAHYLNTFKTNVEIDWIDQGGTSDDLRFVRTKFAANPKTAGIDVFWGGPSSAFIEMDLSKVLAVYNLPKEVSADVPHTAAGVAMYSPKQTWVASAMSTFGIFFNKKLLKIEGLQEPKSWKDLTSPKFAELVSQTDPRRSGTAALLNNIILQSYGWDHGWEILTQIAGNTRMFTHSSSDPVKAVVDGEAVAALMIDFYAYGQIFEMGADKLGFILPDGQIVLDPDPVAILKGAPNRKVAERFINYLLGTEAQSMLMLPKGAPNGPKNAFLARFAINSKSYELTEGKRLSEFNPYKLKASLHLDSESAGKTNRVCNDLVGALFVDTHKDLKAAWTRMIKNGSKPSDLAAFAKMPLTQKEFLAAAEKWDNDVFRNKTINNWVSFAKRKYQALANNSH